MTAQVPDKFLFKGEEYVLIGVKGGKLIFPEQFGMTPEMITTACYRGFHCNYELTGEALYLRELTLREKDGNYLPIDGVEPAKWDYMANYTGLDLLVDFTGILRLAKDFIPEFYIHMGFQKATAFRTVLDVTLDAGRVVGIKDRSSDVAHKRGAFKRRYETGDVGQGIAEAFSLDLELE